MRWRDLLLGVALAAALVAYPRPVRSGGAADSSSAGGHRARVLAVWCSGPLRSALEGVPSYTEFSGWALFPEPVGRQLGRPGPGSAHSESAPAPCLAPEEALAALSDRTRPRVDVAVDPGAGGARALPRLLAAVERRARGEGELWLVALVERGTGSAGADIVRCGLHGSAALRGPLGPELALDLRWLGDGLTSEHLEAWFAAHVAGPPESACERWPLWLQRRPALGAELTANGDARYTWPSGSDPPGWTAHGRVARAVTADGRAWFEAPDGWCSLFQRLTLPDSPGPNGAPLAVRLAARFAPGTRGTVQVLSERGSELVPFELTESGERRALLPPSVRSLTPEVRLTGSSDRDARGDAVPPRLTEVSIRVVPAEE